MKLRRLVGRIERPTPARWAILGLVAVGLVCEWLEYPRVAGPLIAVALFVWLALLVRDWDRLRAWWRG
jgi:uncharacterized membrane protein